MEFLQEVFARYWREVVVAMLLTATLPFFRRYVRRLRARVIAFFTARKRLEQALTDAENSRKRAEEAERKYQSEVEERRKVEAEAEHLRKELEESRKAQAEAERVSTSKVSKLVRTFNIFSGTKEAGENNEELERLKSALERAERLRQNEAKLKNRALAEVQRLNALLTKAQQELQAIESAKPAPDSMTAKLLELLRACEELPYPENTNFWRVSNSVKDFLPPNGDVLRMKVMNVSHEYISDYEDSTRQAKFTVFYVLMILAQGVSEKLITIDNNKKLTWKRASALLDKVNAEYFNEHPEVSKPDDYYILNGKSTIADAFGKFPPEVLLKDKAFIQDLLPATNTATSKGMSFRLFD